MCVGMLRSNSSDSSVGRQHVGKDPPDTPHVMWVETSEPVE